MFLPSCRPKGHNGDLQPFPGAKTNDDVEMVRRSTNIEKTEIHVAEDNVQNVNYSNTDMYIALRPT